MTNYGLPLKFKAVEIISGKVVSTNKLVLDLDGQWYALYSGDTVRFDEEWPDDLLIYQFTGHKDSNSKEVFFGDIVINTECRIGIAEWIMSEVCFDIECGEIMLKDLPNQKHPDGTDWGGGLHNVSILDSCVVIGNIYTLPDQLKASAEKVRGQC